MRTSVGLTAAAVIGLGATAAVALVPTPADRAEVKRSGTASSASSRCDRTATSAESLSSEFRAARAGATVCLASGNYGTFHGAAKRGIVNVRPQPGASASLSLDFDGVRNIRIEGVTITQGRLTGGTRNVTIARSRFTGIFIVEQQTRNPNIVLNRNTHNNIPGAADDYTSRVHLDAPGVVVKNSLLSGGSSDGIRVGAAPNARIIGNEFTAFIDIDPLHTDPIQFYGPSPGATVRGNWFHDMAGVSAHIMKANGGGPHVIEDNLFGPGGNHAFSITWYSDDNSIIRHNTFVDDDCSYNLRCGSINLGHLPGYNPGRGTVIEDNILARIDAGGNGEGGGASKFSSNHNLLRGQNPIGPGDVRGAPRYVSPLASGNVGRRKAFAGYRLRRGSRGRGNASDGTDRGIR